MDVVWLTLGIVLMIAGLAGCVLPFLPGPPLSFAALWIQQLQSNPPYTNDFLLWWGGITVAVTALDYLIPVYGTRRFGGSKYGMWGCMIGLVFGFWLGPFGLILGPFLGALVGELIFNRNSDQALRAAMGSFLGFLVGTLAKLIACLVMFWYLVDAF